VRGHRAVLTGSPHSRGQGRPDLARPVRCRASTRGSTRGRSVSCLGTFPRGRRTPCHPCRPAGSCSRTRGHQGYRAPRAATHVSSPGPRECRTPSLGTPASSGARTRPSDRASRSVARQRRAGARRVRSVRASQPPASTKSGSHRATSPQREVGWAWPRHQVTEAPRGEPQTAVRAQALRPRRGRERHGHANRRAAGTRTRPRARSRRGSDLCASSRVRACWSKNPARTYTRLP
jgi:hypothetical protein